MGVPSLAAVRAALDAPAAAREQYRPEDIQAFGVGSAAGQLPPRVGLGESAENPSGQYDFEFGRPYNANMRHLTGAEYDLREFRQLERLELLRRAHQAWERNPYAKAGVRLIRNFVTRTGHTVTTKATQVQRVIDAFRQDPLNRIQQYDKELCDQLLIDGEVFLRFNDPPRTRPSRLAPRVVQPPPAPRDPQGTRRGNDGGDDQEDGGDGDLENPENDKRLGAPISNRVVVDPIPPWWVEDFILDPNFRVIVRSYRVRFRRGESMEQQGVQQELVDVPADRVLHVAINKLGYELRGRSELLPILPWLKAYKDFLEDRVRINRLKGAMLYDVTIKGTQPGTIAAKRAQYRTPPPPNSVVIHSDAETWQTVDNKINAQDSAEDGRQVKLATAVGFGLPEYALGDGENSNRACYDDQTEVLTRRGWVRHDALLEGDEAAAVEPQSGRMFWTSDWTLYRYPYQGQMIAFKDRHQDVLVTPDHRMSVRYRRQGVDFTRDRKWKLGERRPLGWHILRAQEIVEPGADRNRLLVRQTAIAPETDPAELAPHVIPGVSRVTRQDLPDMPVERETWLRFLGWFVSEGCTCASRTGKTHIVALSQKKPQNVPLLRAALEALPIQFHENRSADGTYRWMVGHKALFKHLLETCGADASEKRLPDECLDLSRPESRILLESLLLGDGHRHAVHDGSRGWTYSTTSPVLADQVQILALRCGYAARMRAVPEYRTNRQQPYVVVIREKRTEVVIARPVEQTYSGEVFCLQVPTGIYVTRRNGKVAVHGNTSSSQQLPMLANFADYQDTLGHFWHEVYEFVIDGAIEAGILEPYEQEVDSNGEPVLDPVSGLPKMVDVHEAFGVEYPPPDEGDPKNLADALAVLAQNGWIDDESAIQETGRDPVVIMSRLRAQEAAEMERVAQGLAFPPSGVGGPDLWGLDPETGVPLPPGEGPAAQAFAQQQQNQPGRGGQNGNSRQGSGQAGGGRTPPAAAGGRSSGNGAAGRRRSSGTRRESAPADGGASEGGGGADPAGGSGGGAGGAGEGISRAGYQAIALRAEAAGAPEA